MLRKISGLLHKEFQLELKRKQSLMGVLLFSLSSVFILYQIFAGSIQSDYWPAIYWLILLFVSINAVSNSVLKEQPGNMLYLFTLSSPKNVILSKTIYNCMLVIAISMLNFGLFILLFGAPPISITGFVILLVLASIGLSSILTLLSMMALKSGEQSTMVAVLSFPILLPLLLVLARATDLLLSNDTLVIPTREIVILFALDIVVILLSILLFPYLWRD